MTCVIAEAEAVLSLCVPLQSHGSQGAEEEAAV